MKLEELTVRANGTKRNADFGFRNSDLWAAIPKSEIRNPHSEIPFLFAVLFRFALDTDAGPGNGFQAGVSDFILAVLADAVGALINSMDRIFDRAE